MPTGLSGAYVCADHARADAAAARLGVALEDLMKKAGEAVAKAVSDRWTPRPTLVACGPGDNGGDGFVAAARLAHAGWPVRVALLEGGTPSEACARAREGWRGEVIPLDANALGKAELVVDAMFGAGLSRPIEGAAAALIAAVEAAKGGEGGGLIVVAVDAPSGVAMDAARPLGSALSVALTVTFGRCKPGHLIHPARALCGEIVLADIGHPEAAWDGLGPVAIENLPQDWIEAWPWPDALSHKHARGSLMVVTGGAAFTGAARLAARAGLRAGAGLVTLLCQPSALFVAAATSTAVMTRSFATPEALAEAASRASAVVIGPGAGVGGATRDCVSALAATEARLVLDADALTSFGDDPSALFALARPTDVFTPHVGEFRRVFPDLDLAGDKRLAVEAAAARAGCVVLLKGADTLIAAPGETAIVNVADAPFLATAGSGDVLAGVIGGLLAQGMETRLAAAAAAWVHGEAGARLGPGLIAEDVCEALPMVLGDLYAWE